MSDNHEHGYERIEEVFEVNVHDSSTQETEIDVKALGYAIAYVKVAGKPNDDGSIQTVVITGANGLAPEEIATACYGLLEMHPEAKECFDQMIEEGTTEPIEIEIDDNGNVKNSDYDEFI